MPHSPRSTLLLALLALAVPASAQAADGALDPAFGTAGHTVVAPSESWSDGHDVLALPGGRSLVVGTALVDGALSTTLVTLGADGRPDDVRTDALGGGSTGDAAVRDADGRVVVVGSAPGGGEDQRPRWLVARYGADGAPDTAFGDDGVRLDAFGPYADETGIGGGATAVAIDGAGRIVVAGYAYYDDGPYSGATARHVVVVRYTADGQVDHAFGPDGRGWVEARPDGGDATPHGVVVEPSGAIVVAGGETRWSRGTSTDHENEVQWQVAFLARFGADGALDVGFGDEGFATAELVSDDASIYGREATAEAIAREDDGDLVIAGRGTDANGFAPAVARFTAGGEPQGVTLLPTPAGGALGDLALDHGRVVVSGTYGDALLVARVGADGTPDATFGAAGQVRLEAADGGELSAVALDASARILAAGTQDGQIHAVRLTGGAPAQQDDGTPPTGDGHGSPQPGTSGTKTTTSTAPAATPPAAAPVTGAATARRCVSRRYLTYRLRVAGLERGTLTLADARGKAIAGRRVKRVRGGLRLDLSGLTKGTYRVTLAGTTTKGTSRRVTRTLRTCAPRGTRTR